MIPIYNSEQIKAWDKFTLENEPISSENLMERAATNFTRLLVGRHMFNSASIFCGVGNNGGDGLVVARILHEQKIKVKIYIVNFSQNQSADFKVNLSKLSKTIEVNYLNEADHHFTVNEDIVLDAIFGAGLNREMDEWVSSIISKINATRLKIISIDLPSGLYTDISIPNINRHIIQAAETFTFQYPKLSFFFEENQKFIGNFFIVDIGLHKNFNQLSHFYLFNKKDIALPKRALFAHKGNFGKALIVAGYTNYGAAILASKAAYKCGCGYVMTNTNSDFANFLITAIPECLTVKNIEELSSDKFDAIAFGPGMGTTELAKVKLIWSLKQNKPIVIDADGLNILAENIELFEYLQPNSILTPHVKELERLVGRSKTSFERLAKQIEFSKKHHIIIVQKGAFTKTSFPDGTVIINGSGNSNLATAGSGDVLTGMIASYLAQGFSQRDAVLTAIYLHGHAADNYLRRIGSRGMLASDVITELQKVLNEF